MIEIGKLDSQVVYEKEHDRFSLRIYDNGEGYIDYTGKGRERGTESHLKLIGMEELEKRGLGWLCVGKQISKGKLMSDLRDELFISSSVVKGNKNELGEMLASGDLELSGEGVSFEMEYPDVGEGGYLHINFKLDGMYGGKSQSNMVKGIIKEMYEELLEDILRDIDDEIVIGGIVGGWVRAMGSFMIGGIDIKLAGGLV